jgi:cysteine desulfurase
MDTPGPGTDTGVAGYADAGSAAPLHPAAVAALADADARLWADQRRLHPPGRRARAALDDAVEELAVGLGCRADEVVLTAGLAQALRWGVRGTRAARHRVGDRVVVSAVEHAALLREAGPDALVVPVDAVGRPLSQAWDEAVGSPGVVLACLQLANHEIGTVQHLTPGPAPLLCDVSAAVAHLDVPVLAREAALLAASPAVWGAPSGLGILVVRTGTRWWRPEPQGDDLVPVPLVVAAAAALTAVTAERIAEAARLRALTDRLRTALAEVPDLMLHGDPVDRLPGLVAVSALYVDAEALISHLGRAGLAVHSGSSCTSDVLEPSHVLVATGALTQGNLRITLGRTTTAAEVDRLIAEVPRAVEAVRSSAGVVGL